MKLAFVFVGGQKDAWVVEAAEEYVGKIRHYVPVELIRLKPTKLARAAASQKKADESREILKQLKPDDLVIICDEKGQEPASIKFSQKLVSLFERGRPRVVVVIGGAFGISDELQARADWKWSLSQLTFNHHIAQTVVLEQVYRALTIWKGIPYHNE